MPNHRIFVGHVIDQLRDMDKQSVHCVVTSPPYFGLRSYGTDPQIWGAGDTDCEHVWAKTQVESHVAGGNWTQAERGDGRKGNKPGGYAHSSIELTEVETGFCQLCGAWLGHLGLEPDFALYLSHLVEIFREVWRVLRHDGTVWLNLGDSHWNKPEDGTFKPKDLMLVPARVAIALSDDGWRVRSDIIWAKTTPMPESCRDRPTQAHEHIFLLSRSRRYFYDPDAIRQPIKESSIARLSQANLKNQTGGAKDHATNDVDGRGNPNSIRKALLNQAQALQDRELQEETNEPPELLIAQEKWKRRHELWHERDKTIGANIRNVWLLGPEPFPEAHFATFVTEVPRRAIKAGTSEYGVCSNCGAPWARDVVRTSMVIDRSDRAAAIGDEVKTGRKQTSGQMLEAPTSQTVGWSPTCVCDTAQQWKPRDFEILWSPTGFSVDEDRRLTDGRRGLNQRQSPDTGVRPITRYEHRKYAEQLRASEHLEAMKAEAGPTAFANYIRFDHAGMRAIPQKYLELWITRGWLVRVELPARNPYPTKRAKVLDIFLGSATTMLVADELGRDCDGIELSGDYVDMGLKRVRGASPMFAQVEVYARD